MQIRNVVNVSDYGATGDGQTDDYDSVLAACQEINRLGGGILSFPQGVYSIPKHRIDAGDGKNNISNFVFNECHGLVIEGNNSVLDFSGNWVRKNDYTNRNLTYSYHNAIGIELIDCSCITIKNIELNGNCNSTTKQASTEGYSHGLIISGCENITVSNIYIHHYHADGMYVGSSSGSPSRIQSKYLYVSQSKFLNNARQGCSIINLRYSIFTDCSFSETGRTGKYGGHSPQAGVDIEPNYEGDFIDDLTGNIDFVRCDFVNNSGSPYVGSSSTSTPYPIAFYDCLFSCQPGQDNAIVAPISKSTSFYSCKFKETLLRPNYATKDTEIDVEVISCIFENTTPHQSAVLTDAQVLPNIKVKACTFIFNGNNSAKGKYRIYLQGNSKTVFSCNSIQISRFEHDNNVANELKFLLRHGILAQKNSWSTDLNNASFCISYGGGSHFSEEMYSPVESFCPWSIN